MDVYALHHVTVNVKDLAEAREFYEGMLGLREVPRPKSFNFAGAWYQMGAAQIHLIEKDEGAPLSTRHFALLVHDAAEARKQVEEAGLETEDQIDIPGTEP